MKTTMATQKRKKSKPKNKLFERLSEMLKECSSWPEFNIKMVMNGYDLDNDTLIVLIHVAFTSIDGWSLWFTKTMQLNELESVASNARNILVGACEDTNCKFTDQMIDTILKKTIFDCSAREFKIPTDLHQRILKGAGKKNPIAFKNAYERYSTFAKYGV